MEKNKITKENFFRKSDGHDSPYSCFMLIGTTAEAVIGCLNEIVTDNHYVGNGFEKEVYAGSKAVWFEIGDESPDLVYELTKKLKCTGYADTDWDEEYTICAKNGKEYYGWSAGWDEGYPVFLGEPDYWDAFFTITDTQTGLRFPTGAEMTTEKYIVWANKFMKRGVNGEKV